jgi:hypothetical protein
MIFTNLQGVASAVVRRAQRQGFIVPREVREELQNAGLPADLWNEVISLVGPALSRRQRRYYYSSPVSAPREKERLQQRSIQQAVRQLVKRFRAEARQGERRRHDRIDFIQPVKVVTEDRHELTLLSRDLSSTGLRLISGRSLLGQKVQVTIPGGDGSSPSGFVVRILWTCAVGDGLFENGGNFLETIN